MKIFAVYAKVKLTDPPAWLDSFRRKYDDPYDYHVTLKQPCRIDDSAVPEVKRKLSDLFGQMEPLRSEIRLLFDTVCADTDRPAGACIMINCYGAGRLHDLQQKIVAALAGYTDYVKVGSGRWETDFQPHITVARHLSPARYAAAMKELPESYQCEGIAAEVALTVVDNLEAEEATNPKNVTVYKLP
jgi:2'-5' RNA ligase